MLLLRVIQLASDICGDKILSSDWGGWHRPAWPRPGVVDFSNSLLKRQAIFPNFYLTLRFHKECVLTVWPTCHHNNYRFVPIAAANKWCRVCVMHLSMIDLYLCKCLGSSLLLSRRKKKKKKRATSQISSSCNNVAKQVARCRCPFCHSVTTDVNFSKQ